jgi:hypothetical protein
MRTADVATFESVLAQLRHAYALAVHNEAVWTPAQRKRFAEGLLGPQIEKLEEIVLDYERKIIDLSTACQANLTQRRRFSHVEEDLLAHASEIGSASQAKRIIHMAFRNSEKL